MELLNYDVLEKSGYKGYVLKDAPIRVLQFGEGNFMRAFVDYFFDISNEKAGFNGKVALVQPISMGLTELVNKQEGLYTLYLRGSENGQKVDAKRVISACDCCLNPYEKSDFDRIMEIAGRHAVEATGLKLVEQELGCVGIGREDNHLLVGQGLLLVEYFGKLIELEVLLLL